MAQAIDPNLDQGFGILVNHVEEVGVWANATPMEKDPRLLTDYCKRSNVLSTDINIYKDRVFIAAIAVISDRLGIKILDPIINAKINSLMKRRDFNDAYLFFSDYFDFAIKNMPTLK